MTKTTMSGRRRRHRAAFPSCLLCALCSQPYLVDVEAFSPFRLQVATSSHDQADIPPTPHNNNAPIATVATSAIMALSILSASPLSSHASDASPSDITASILRRQIVSTKLSETEAFQKLRREPPTTRSLRELTQLQDLQDARLDACADRGTLWEQCFMFGDSESNGGSSGSGGGGGSGGTKAKKGATNLRNGLDYQYLSPVGALESGNNSDQPVSPASTRPKTTVPTW